MKRETNHRGGIAGAVRFLAVVSLALGPLWMVSLTWAAKPSPPEDPDAFVEAPIQLVEQTLEKIIAVLQDTELSQEERRQRIETLAFAVFDFQTMSKLVLARNWKRLDGPQRETFVSEFKVYLSRNYGSRLDRFRQTDVTISGARVEPRNDVTVFSQVAEGEYAGVELNYRLRQRKGQWRVIDVVIEGVSLVANFRSQFREVLSRKGPEALIRQLQKKNAQPVSDSSERDSAESSS